MPSSPPAASSAGTEIPAPPPVRVSRWNISPMFPVWSLLVVMGVIGVPIGYCCDDMGVFKLFARGLSDAVILEAYRWTLYACVALVGLYHLLGIAKQVKAYQRRPMLDLSQARYRRLWNWSFVGTLLSILVMFVQAGFTVPLAQTTGLDYLEYALYRTEVATSVNQTLFNAALYLVATPNLVLAWFCLTDHKWRYRILSTAALIAVGAFTLARSPVALAGLIVMNFIILAKPASPKLLFWAGTVSLVVLLGTHLITGDPAGYVSIYWYLAARVIYGEWMGLPYFFVMFRDHPAPFASLLPPNFQALIGQQHDAPARLVMAAIVPEAVAEGSAGVASSFFIGDAYALAGNLGIVIAPLLVMLQLWAMVWCFRSLPKSPLTVFLFAWFLFRMLMGLLSGFSAFVLSGLQFAVIAIIYWAIARSALTKQAASLPQGAA
jgi:hypothetical protein